MMVVYGVLLMSSLALGLAITGLLAVYRSSKPLFVAAILLLVGGPLAGYVAVTNASMLQDVPRALGVDSILHDGRITWSLADAGVRVYALPPDAIANITAGGEVYLNSLPPNRSKWLEGWRGDYSQHGGWRRTPMAPGRHWQLNAEAGTFLVPDYFTQRDWRMVRHHEDVARQIEAAVNRPGSFYAVGRAGTLIISPAVRKVFYIHTPYAG